jgi:hypothetical protein
VDHDVPTGRRLSARPAPHRRLTLLALVATGLVGLHAPARAEGPDLLTPDLRFVLGPDFGTEAGILTVDSLARLLWLYEEPLGAALRIDESTTAGFLAARLGRSLKLLFLDFPLAIMSVNIVHEVFGHGPRVRELGQSPAFVFRLPEPYDLIFESGRVGSGAASTSFAWSGNLDYDVATVAGGVDADQLHAAMIGARVVRRGGVMHHGEALTYLLSKTTYVQDLGDPRHAREGGDIALYVRLLALRHGRWQAAAIDDVARSLQLSYLVGAFADWTLWWALFRLGHHGATGEATDVLPMIALGPVRLLPTVRFGLSPFGAEHTLEVLAAYDGMLLGARARATFSGLASAWGGGLEAIGWRPGGGLELGGTLDLWTQPELVLEQRGVLDRRQAFGGALALHATWSLASGLGVTGKLAYKSRGYLVGQPLDAGFHGYLGLSLAFDGRPSLVPETR